MAATSYERAAYGYATPGSSDRPPTSRSPSPGQRAYSPHPRTYDYHTSTSSPSVLNDRAHDQSSNVPDLRVTTPLRVGQAPEDALMEDDRSVYSERMSEPQSYYSQLFQSGSRKSSESRDSWDAGAGVRPDSNVEPFSFMAYESRPQLPKVVVSSPSDSSTNRGSYFSEAGSYTSPISVVPDPTTPPPTQSAAGRVPSAVQGVRNFSRPNKMANGHPGREIRGTEQEKREVLERNQRRLAQAQTHRPQPQHASSFSSVSTSASLSYSSPSSSYTQLKDDARQSSVNDLAARTGQSWSTPPRTGSPAGVPSPPPIASSSSSFSSAQLLATPQESRKPTGLPSKPPVLRSSTTESVYSMYSYYQLESPASSPTTLAHDKTNKLTNSPEAHTISASVSPPSSVGRKSPKIHQEQVIEHPQTAEDYLGLGIAHHEADRLEESARCFEQAATLDGGCAVGMLMWGLSLRHGWGTQKNEQRAFKWLKKAAEHAVVNLQQGKSSSGSDVIKNELVLAVYEVGQCFFQGWGVPKDKAMGVSYFQTAAQLGDPDAQQDLAFCLANGKGCKKDRKAAAKWYRAAAAQGASTVGLAWIYKPKFAD